ncbi:MAG: ABC transporter ATP-binding protein [Phycisphaerales bacterium]|nr:ABC transporter ATP-binding protein [Phycisphaerales bacterium]MCB9862260.1 ABC transporter ATP-binding protein [Phycisphaerales bacterium]
MTKSINVNGVFKKFRRGERHNSLRDAVGSWLRLDRGHRRSSGLDAAEFWALQEMTFDVQPGEAFGIIGPNGAGKSTMLKLLAGILRPNRGTISIEGRVSALIEVGAGFHPDLTGRENIYMNAAILGMRRKEVDHKFEDIVEFAGIRDFLDTPIKRYSSGMYARLGFSVAAHVEPDVLLVDEVLSVGDRVFRAKCMDKMRGFLDRGVAVVYVSHDLRSVASFCDRAMVISDGCIQYTGGAAEAVAQYHEACIDASMLPSTRKRSLVDVSPVRFVDKSGRDKQTFTPGEEITIEFDVRYNHAMARPSFGLSLIRTEDRLVMFETSSTRMHYQTPPAVEGTCSRVRYRIALNVPPGEYLIGYHVRDRDSALYAAMQEDARIMVIGESISGGVADLAPKVAVEDVDPRQHEMNVANVGRAVAS